MKKKVIAIFAFFSILLLCGCQTIKGAAVGAAEGMKKDLAALKKADSWIRKNLW